MVRPVHVADAFRIDALATAVIESTSGSVQGFHRIAGNAAITAACDAVSARDRACYRLAEAESLLRAVFATTDSLSAADMLAVAARIAERAVAEESVA
jgi:hypothetical protein